MRRRTFLQHATGLALATGPLQDAATALARPTARKRTQTHNRDVIDQLFELDKPVRRWEWIVVHHTAFDGSSFERIDRYHRRKFNDPLGIEYHFLIGNGRKKPKGFIEPARWVHQELAIHLFHPERAPGGIAVSLVGNFQEQKPGRYQMSALVDLTWALMKGCGIDAEHVTTHRRVDGRLTQCPGRLFPYERFMRRVRSEG